MFNLKFEIFRKFQKQLFWQFQKNIWKFSKTIILKNLKKQDFEKFEKQRFWKIWFFFEKFEKKWFRQVNYFPPLYGAILVQGGEISQGMGLIVSGIVNAIFGLSIYDYV